MATRLPVVISQAARRESAMVTCEENLVTELLFTSGLDATLIGPLESIEHGSTDHLCLEGLKGPFALLGWNSASDCINQLSRMGIHGAIFDRDTASPAMIILAAENEIGPPRRIDYFQLDSNLDTRTWVDSLKKILEVREVKAFSIQLSPASSSKAVSLFNQRLDRTKQEGDAPAEPNAAPQERRPPVTPVEPKSLVFPRKIDPNDEKQEWEHLDELVDDLDHSDV